MMFRIMQSEGARARLKIWETDLAPALQIPEELVRRSIHPPPEATVSVSRNGILGRT